MDHALFNLLNVAYALIGIYVIACACFALNEHFGRKKLTFLQIHKRMLYPRLTPALCMVALAITPVRWYHVSFMPYLLSGRTPRWYSPVEVILIVASAVLVLSVCVKRKEWWDAEEQTGQYAQEQIPASDTDNGYDLLHRTLEDAYKSQYDGYLRGLRSAFADYRQGDPVPPIFTVLYNNYVENICETVLSVFDLKDPRVRFRFNSAKAHLTPFGVGDNALALKNVREIDNAFAVPYACLYYAVTVQVCSREEAQKQCDRFDLYSLAAIRHAAKANGIILH